MWKPVIKYLLKPKIIKQTTKITLTSKWWKNHRTINQANKNFTVTLRWGRRYRSHNEKLRAKVRNREKVARDIKNERIILLWDRKIQCRLLDIEKRALRVQKLLEQCVDSKVDIKIINWDYCFERIEIKGANDQWRA